jgi:tRNA(Ile)-lysidine synthase
VRACLADLSPGDRVLVALSGGPDSLALVAATVRVAAEQGLVCGAVVVDHGLQRDSAEVARRAAEQARILGCTQVEVVRVAVDTGPGSGGPEAAARSARYAALRRAALAAPAACAVLLGHTRDDQAETVLLGIARGSGTRSLAGMAPVAGILRRPLLDLPREVVASAAAAAAQQDPRLQPWHDPHNEHHGHARVRVRAEVLPIMERAVGPGAAEALARTARLARADADALDAWADRVWIQQVLPVLGGGPGGAGGVFGGPGGAPAPPVVRGPGGSPAPPVVGSTAPETANEAAAGGDLDPTVHAGGAGGRVAVPMDLLVADGAQPLPAAVTGRLVRRLLVAAGCPEGSLAADHVWRVTDLLRAAPAGAEVALPGRRRARREERTLVVRT